MCGARNIENTYHLKVYLDLHVPFTVIFLLFQDESHLPHTSITWNRNPYAMEYDHYCQRGKILQLYIRSSFRI